MKKWTALVLTTIFLLSNTAAYAENTANALEAFSALTGTEVTLSTVARTTDEYLDKVMAGDYLIPVEDEATAGPLSLELAGLSAVTTKDIAVYAAARQHPAAQVRNLYFRSLANVLRAEILVNPASEEEYKNIQVILSLFLDESSDNLTRTSREAIRTTITSDHARQIAQGYNLPESFVEFVIMDDKWDDDSWENDYSWQVGSDWNTDDLYDDSLENYIDTDGIAGNSLDNSPASVDHNSPASVDYNSPASVDYNSPASVDYNSPASVDYSSPASVDYNTPEYNSPASVDYSSPASVDYSSGSGSGSYDS